MSKRYSGKSFKDASVMKKPKLSLKEKRKLKKEKAKKSEVYKKVLEAFPDAELINIEQNVEQNND